MKKKLLVLVLTLAMVITAMSAVAWAGEQYEAEVTLSDGKTKEYFNSFATAIEAVDKGDKYIGCTLKLLKDISVEVNTGTSNYGHYCIDGGKFTIDGDKHTISAKIKSGSENGYVFNVRGDVTFNDLRILRSADASGTEYLRGGINVPAEVTVNINDCYIDMRSKNSNEWNTAVVAGKNSTVVINKGTYYSGIEGDYRGINIDNNKSFTFIDGETNGIVAEYTVVYHIKGGTHNVTGITHKGTVNSIGIGVSGGTYANDPTLYVASGCSVIENDTNPKTWTVIDNFYQDSVNTNTWHVVNLAGLKELRDSINNGNVKYANQIIEIDNDIDMTSDPWTPINAYQSGSALSGTTIDGNGHSIKGMTITVPENSKSYDYGVGFISQQAGSLTISAISFVSANVNAPTGSQVGVVVGMSYGNVAFEDVDIVNCNVLGATKTGAYLGQNDDGNTVLLKDCVIKGSVVKANYSAALMIGLLNTNSMEVVFNNCSADDNSKFEWVTKADDFPDKGVEIDGRYFAISGTTLWLTDPGEGCWAEQRVSGAKLTYGQTEYDVKGSVFYPNDIAAIGNVKYDSLEAAVSACNDGDTIELLRNATVGNKITINKNVTINGNNKQITYTGSDDQIFYFDATDKSFIIKNCEIHNKSTKELYGLFNVKEKSKGKILIDRCIFADDTGDASAIVTHDASANGDHVLVEFTNNTVNEYYGGVFPYTREGSIFSGNQFNNIGRARVISPITNDGSTATIVVTDNTFVGCTKNGIISLNKTNAVTTLEIHGNTITNCNNVLLVETTAVLTANSEITNLTGGTIIVDNNGSDTVGDLTITDGAYKGKDSAYTKEKNGTIVISGGYFSSFIAKTDLAENYECIDNPDSNKGTYPYKVGKVKSVLTMSDYAYMGSTVSTPSVSNLGSATARIYYSATSFLQTSVGAIEWTNITPGSIIPGTYFMKAYLSDGTETDQITFNVKKGSKAAPTAPTVNGLTVTIAEADRTKNLEYCVSDSVDEHTNWISVPTLTDGTFTLSGLNAGDYKVFIRERENKLYFASDAVASDVFTVSNFSVSYNANYGVGTVASQTAAQSSTITVASGATLSRTGYTFAGWNTQADGNGSSYSVGSSISVGAVLYAQWTPNTYTVRFNANTGSGNMSSQSFTYDVAQALSANTFTKSGYNFVGWATRADGPVVYPDKQNVSNVAASGAVDLYAVWAQAVGTVTANITSTTNEAIKVEVKYGPTVIQSKENIIPTLSGSVYVANDIVLSDIPYGTYNLVVTQGNVVSTQIIINGESTTANVTMPDRNVNSVLEVKGEDTKPVVVGGLNEEAESKKIEDQNVYVLMTVEKTEEQVLPETASAKEQDSQQAIEAITEKAEDDKRKETSTPSTTVVDDLVIEFFDVTVELYVTDSAITNFATVEPTDVITETNNVIEIVVPYDMNGKDNIKVYRYHDSVAEAFTKLNAKPLAPYIDGQYYVDEAHSLIYIYAQKFSTYGIAYIATNESGNTDTPIYVPITPVKKDDKKDEVKDYTTCGKDNTCPLYVYKDLKVNDWYHDGVHFCLDNKYMNGYAGINAGKFGPDDKITRAQIVSILWRMAGSPVVNYNMTYTDVKATEWYADAVRWATSTGVVKGNPDGTFKPEDYITREALAQILYGYAKLKGEGFTGSWMFLITNTDANKISSWASEAMHWVIMKQVMGGDNHGLLRPQGTATRAEAATMIQRFCGVLETK